MKKTARIKITSKFIKIQLLTEKDILLRYLPSQYDKIR